jgi:lysozyme
MNTKLAAELAARIARRFEGFFPHPYLCPAGVPTIGYGATYYENGVRVTLLDPPVSKEEAERLLIWMIETEYLPAAIKLCPGIDTPERLAAITDFAYNLGVSKLSSSTLRKRINTGDWADVPVQLAKWNKAGGRVLSGLTRRRTTEAALC